MKMNSLSTLEIPQAPPRHTRTIEIVCHRGANQYAPENTYASAQICIDWQMDYVEIDVNTSRDGVLFLMHGPELHKTTSGTGHIGDWPAAEIDQLDAGSWFHPAYADQRVPRLEPFLHWAKGKTKLFLDVKAADHRQLLDLIYASGFANECFFWSGDKEWARQLYKLAPDLAIKINVSSPADVVNAHEHFGARIVEMDLKHLNQPLIDACRQSACDQSDALCKREQSRGFSASAPSN
ncbi:MAG: glycerophosphodiester phosphodiesterase family protein [Caldilineaceae bacterium]